MGKEKHMNKKIYTYRNSFFFQKMPIILYYISFPFFILLSIGYVLEIVTGNLVLQNTKSVIKMVVAMVMPIYLPIFFSSEMNMFPDIKFEHDYLWIRIFTYRWVWKKISWEEIHGAQVSKKKYRGGDVWLIRVSNHVTLWHKFLGRKYGQENNAYIYVTHFVNDFDEFVEELMSRTSRYSPAE